jgi:ABC-type bacteriocin/lantibiotic exporter with double-glycine peptidase domain
MKRLENLYTPRRSRRDRLVVEWRAKSLLERVLFAAIALVILTVLFMFSIVLFVIVLALALLLCLVAWWTTATRR